MLLPAGRIIPNRHPARLKAAITDAQGGAIAGAQIRLTNQSTREGKEATLQAGFTAGLYLPP